MCESREGGGQGVRTPLPENSLKNIGFLSNTGPDPLINHKATKPAFNILCHLWHVSETGGPMMDAYSGIVFESSLPSSTKMETTCPGRTPL